MSTDFESMYRAMNERALAKRNAPKLHGGLELTPFQESVMAVLEDGPWTNMKSLADHLDVRPCRTQRVARALRAMGLVTIVKSGGINTVAIKESE